MLLDYVGCVRISESDKGRQYWELSLDLPNYMVNVVAKTRDELWAALGRRLLQDAGYQYVDLSK